ncbi:GNAT family N-acetyltransferase [Vibrio sp. Vb5032]|uniref:GNAT family N-acetyltransferase n=1 Tax=unclassified Vibrio TaxID=2614977 RepID=UPI001A24A861|nr:MULTISPECIES: GNAT family N-acetyltransferase [unclassified Vibrio]EGQ7761430.1 GNAT family N-acetyltransferase [Vibrio alginolyticus]EGR2606378.1 N-acetyltransferase [Vibrio alginolyticus]MDW1522638.1 GNAT family N-acetyltransferase [Vibrio sp. Vb5032]MDW2001182.1 GNAT family N-acetyltransferase [Vibrio sp. 2304]
MEQCVVREAIDSDAQSINNVSQYLGYAVLSDSVASKKLSELIESESDKVYVAEFAGKIVGWVHLYFVRRLASDNYFEVGGLVVHPDYRRKGIGKLLIQSAVSEQQGRIRVRSNQLRVEAHKFYEQLGFHGNKVQRVFEIRS